jgi:hypothetical protein
MGSYAAISKEFFLLGAVFPNSMFLNFSSSGLTGFKSGKGG